MTLPPKTQSMPCATAPLSLAVPPKNDKGQVMGRMPFDSVEHFNWGSRKRRTSQLFNPIYVQHWPSSKRQRPSDNIPLVGLQDHVALLKPSVPQSRAETKVEGSKMNVVEENHLGQIYTSSAIQLPLSIKIRSIDKGLPQQTAGIQGTICNPLMQEEGCTISGAQWGKRTKTNINPSNQSTWIIDANFLQQVGVAFDKVNANQGGSTKASKGSISMNPNLEKIFLAIRAKYENIIKDYLLESGEMLTSILKAICGVVQDLQKKHLTEIGRNLLDSYYLVVKDVETVKVNVTLLRTRLDEIRDAVNCIVETKKISDKRNQLAEQIKIEKKNLELDKAKLENLKSDINKKESQIKLDILMIEEFNNKISNQALKIQQFQKIRLIEEF